MQPAPGFTDRRIRVLIVEDQQIVRAGIRMFLETEARIDVVGEADNRGDAIAMTRSGQPDVILLDLLLGEDNGLDCVAELLSACPSARVLVLTGVVDPEIREHAVEMGAKGVVLKTDSPEVLLKAIDRVHRGEVWLDRAALGHVLARLFQPRSYQDDSEAAKIGSLTQRERDIIDSVAEGLRNKEIAARLFISEVTVRHHLTSIFSKLALEGRGALLIYAYKHNLTRPTD